MAANPSRSSPAGRLASGRSPRVAGADGAPAPVRNRIVALRFVRAAELIPNPKRWRRHSGAQRRSLRGVLEEVGYAGACVARRSPEGLVLLDGHLRADLDPGAVLPVLVLDVTEEEGEVVLASYVTADPDHVRHLLAETREEVTRADTKASIVLAGAWVVVGFLLTGLVTGDISIAGSRWYVGALAWAAGGLLVGGVGVLGSAVYPRTGNPQRGHARWFAEIERYKNDDAGLVQAVETDQADGMRDLHQAFSLAEIVGRKYRLTKVGMWLLGGGFVTAGFATMLHIWK
jgi:hypothetical protein